MATYYVNNLTGSDSNNGLSEGAPFLTLNKFNALTGLLANDIVRVKATGTDYTLTVNGTNTTIDFFRDSGAVSRNIYLTNWLADGDTKPKIISNKDLANAASAWTFNAGMKNVDYDIDDLTNTTATYNLLFSGSGASGMIKKCKFNFLRTGGATTNAKSITFGSNAQVFDENEINHNNGNGIITFTVATSITNNIFRNMYNSATASLFVWPSGTAATNIMKNIFHNIQHTSPSTSSSLFPFSTRHYYSNNTIIVSDVGPASGNPTRFFPNQTSIVNASGILFFSNILINNKALYPCYYLTTAGGITATYPDMLRGGNNAFYNFTNIYLNFTFTSYPNPAAQSAIGADIILAASPFLSETYGNANYMKLDDSTASGLACIGAAFYDPNIDLGRYQSTGGGAAGETDPNKVLNTSTIITGNYIPVTAANVRAGTIFGLSETGLLNLPAEADVKLSVIFDNATKTGTLESTDPGEANVVNGTTYKINSVSKTGSRTSIYALLSAAIVKIGEDRGDGSFGTYDGAERYSDLDLSQIVSGYNFRYNSLSNNRTGTRTSIYPVLAANLVKIGTDRGDTVTGTYDASERYTDLDLSKVVDDYSFRYNSLIDNRTGLRSAKYPLLPINEVKYDVDRGDGELGSYRALELYTELSQNDVKDGIEYRYNSLTNNKLGNYLAYPLLALDFVKIGVNRGDGQFGTYTAIERYTDLPENEVKLGTLYLYNNVEKTGTLAGGAADYPLESKVLYPTAYAFGTKIGTLGTYNTANPNIAEQINNNAKIVISNVLGAEWQELKYFKEIAKNDFYSNANKFGIRPLNDIKTNAVIGKETLDLEFEIKLTTDFVNQDGDDLERVKELYLIEKMESVRKQLRKTKFGNFNAIRIVKEYSREEVEKLQNADVLVCRAIITVSYGIN